METREIRPVTDWVRSNDRMVKDGGIIFGRMVEVTINDKMFPAVEHKTEGSTPPSHDVSLTWAVPEKLSPKDFAEISGRFSKAFEAYEAFKVDRDNEKARQAAEMEARIAAEVEKRVASKTKKAVAKEE